MALKGLVAALVSARVWRGTALCVRAPSPVHASVVASWYFVGAAVVGEAVGASSAVAPRTQSSVIVTTPYLRDRWRVEGVASVRDR